MKHGIHPRYEAVVFRDRSTGESMLVRSTIVDRLPADQPRLTREDGASYPVVDVDVTSSSHPFWTGHARVMDSEGRVDKFRRRYGSGR